MAIDIGNTAAHFGLFLLNARRPLPARLKTWTLPTHQLHEKGTLNKLLKKLKALPMKESIMSSVVPRVSHQLTSLMRPLKIPLHIVTAKTPSTLKIRVRSPHQLGADRIANARFAWELHKGPSIVIDMGTATTFDCVNARGEFIGGAIAPGPQTGADALSLKTAQLPRVVIKKPRELIGRTPQEAIQTGLYHGTLGVLREITRRLCQKMGPRTHIFLTGGLAPLFRNELNIRHRYVPFLTLWGLYYLWDDNSFFSC